jgi:hypothetical protein
VRSPRRGRFATVVAGALALALVPIVAVIAGLGTTPAVAATRIEVHAVPKKTPANCSRDVTNDLLQWIATVPDRSELSFAKHGCYEIDGTVQLVERHDLVFEGNGATFKALTDGDQSRRHFLFFGGSDIVVRDLTLVGANKQATPTFTPYNAARAFQHGFDFQGVDGVTIDHVNVRDVYGDFVYLGIGRDNTTWTTNVKVTNSDFSGSGRQGISVIAGENVVISHDTIEGVARSMFDLEPNSGNEGAVGVLITDNRLGSANNFIVASKGNGDAGIGDVTLTGNKATAPSGNLVWVSGTAPRGPFLIEHNHFALRGTVHDSGSTGAFFFNRCQQVTVEDNQATFPAGAKIPAVEIRNSQKVRVVHNQFPNAGPMVYDSTPTPAPAPAPTPTSTSP